MAGFRYQPVAGLAPLRDFYGSFGRGVFWSTQYLRHPSVRLYTPEPDVIHEVIGHANQLAGPGYADLYRLVGAAVARTRDEEALRFLSHVFWYTMEFGVVREGGRAAGVRRGHPVVGRGDVQLPRRRPAPVDLLAMGRAELRHHPLPARAVRVVVGRPSWRIGCARFWNRTTTPLPHPAAQGWVGRALGFLGKVVALSVDREPEVPVDFGDRVGKHADLECPTSRQRNCHAVRHPGARCTGGPMAR